MAALENNQQGNQGWTDLRSAKETFGVNNRAYGLNALNPFLKGDFVDFEKLPKATIDPI